LLNFFKKKFNESTKLKSAFSSISFADRFGKIIFQWSEGRISRKKRKESEI